MEYCPAGEKLAGYVEDVCAQAAAARSRGRAEQYAPSVQWVAEGRANEAVLDSVRALPDDQPGDRVLAVRAVCPAPPMSVSLSCCRTPSTATELEMKSVRVGSARSIQLFKGPSSVTLLSGSCLTAPLIADSHHYIITQKGLELSCAQLQLAQTARRQVFAATKSLQQRVRKSFFYYYNAKSCVIKVGCAGPPNLALRELCRNPLLLQLL